MEKNDLRVRVMGCLSLKVFACFSIHKMAGKIVERKKKAGWEQKIKGRRTRKSFLSFSSLSFSPLHYLTPFIGLVSQNP